jgi:serine/threonine-protein kinase RsbW
VAHVSEQISPARERVGDGRIVRLTIPAKPEYITLSRLALAGLARVRPLADDTLADLKLALTEACSNSVRHAYGDGEGHVAISFELLDDRLIVEVADELSEGGLGIAIIRSVADEVEIGGGPDGRGSRLRFVKRL